MLNQGTLDAMINAATVDNEVDAAKLAEVLGKISDKIFGIGETAGGGLILRPDGVNIMAAARGSEFPAMRLDRNGIIQLGGPSYDVTGRGMVSIGKKQLGGSHPVGSSAMDGVIFTLETSIYLYYYQNGVRYYITPTGTW